MRPSLSARSSDSVASGGSKGRSDSMACFVGGEYNPMPISRSLGHWSSGSRVKGVASRGAPAPPSGTCIGATLLFIGAVLLVPGIEPYRVAKLAKSCNSEPCIKARMASSFSRIILSPASSFMPGSW